MKRKAKKSEHAEMSIHWVFSFNFCCTSIAVIIIMLYCYVNAMVLLGLFHFSLIFPVYRCNEACFVLALHIDCITNQIKIKMKNAGHNDSELHTTHVCAIANGSIVCMYHVVNIYIYIVSWDELDLGRVRDIVPMHFYFQMPCFF